MRKKREWLGVGAAFFAIGALWEECCGYARDFRDEAKGLWRELMGSY